MNVEPFTFILERLAHLLIGEIKFLSTDTKNLLRILQQQLELVQSFIRDFEEDNHQAKSTHVLQTEAKHLMQKMPEIEDFLDTFYKDQVQQSQTTYSERFTTYFSRASNPVIRRRKVIKMAKKLTGELQAMLQRAEPYQQPRVCRRPISKSLRPPTKPHIINDEFIIGLDEDVAALVAKLVGDQTTSLAIHGMGGSGKSTIARKLFNHGEIAKRFDRRAWVCISQDWEASWILQSICEQFNIPLLEDKRSVTYVNLQDFRSGSFLIILDDVWKKEALQELLPLLLSIHNVHGSSKVLITTRNEKVVKFHTLGGFHIHSLRGLAANESWDLFSTIVRRNWQGFGSFQDVSGFKQLGREMLEKCNGLPLAIVALAGLLSAKTTIQEWENTKEDVIARIMVYDSGSHDYGALKEMLELSYFDLPYDLKPCFLLLGIYGEDCEIYVNQLVDLWVAEGFIGTNSSIGSKTLEETAKDFLDELVQRCMIQVASRDYEGNALTVRLHDLMRVLCIEKAKKLNFFEIISMSSSSSNSMESTSRRHIVHKWESYGVCNQGARSLICLQHPGEDERKFKLAYKKMKLLRVLFLVRVNLGDSIKQIGNLILLRYLRIQNCSGFKQLPKSIKRLRNLLTLIFIFFNDLTAKGAIPKNLLGDMDHLRHFSLVGKATPSPIISLGVDKPRNLQVLRVFSGDWLSKELRVVNNGLRILILEDVHIQAHLEAVYDFVNNPSCLLHELLLSIRFDSRLEFDLQKMKLGKCGILKSLTLEGKIRKQCGQLLFPPNLLNLDLLDTRIEEEENLMKALAKLNQLRYLYLKRNSYVAEKLTMVGLPQLLELWLWNLFNLKEWRIEEGGLRQLTKLYINDNKLERIPKEISKIHTLQSFTANYMPKSFCIRLQRPSGKEDDSDRGGGEDFHLIEHIHSVIVSTN